MPEKCLSCGESAVMEEEVDGGQVQRICIECGTVASGVKADNVEHSSTAKIECTPFLNMKKEEQVCESCGDILQPSIQADVNMCLECQELEVCVADNREQVANRRDNSEQVANTRAEIQHEISVSQPTVSPVTCKSCHSSNLSMDVCGADERLVCRDCGTVAGNEALMNNDFEITSGAYRGNFVNRSRLAGQYRIVKGRAAGHEKITLIYNKLCLPDVIKDEALEMFNLVFEKPRVFYAHITTKEHIAAACVFIVCRQHDIPVSLEHFRKYVDRYNIFLKGRKIVLKSLNISHPSLTMSSQLDQVLVDSEFTHKVISKVKDILFLYRKAWLTQGRSRKGLIIIAAYYAYVSSVSFISMAKFRQKFNFPNISMMLQSECNSFFLKLASRIPWVLTKNIKPTTVYKYVDDILKYQNSLLQLAFRSEYDDSNKAELTVIQTENTLDKTPKQNKRCKNYAEEEKGVLLPSALKKPRHEVFIPETNISPMVNLDSPDVLASEFDEAEMTSYLLSPEEESVLRTPKLTYMHN